MGNIAFRNYKAGTTGTTTLTVDVPTGTADGDMMVAFVGSDANGTVAQASWNILDQTSAYGAASGMLGALYLEVSGTPPASYDFTVPANHGIGQILTFQNDGAAWDTPVVSTFADDSAATALTSNSPGTPDTNDAIAVGWVNDGGVAQTTDPAMDANTEYTNTGSCGVDVWYSTGITSGAKTYTNTFASADDIGCYAILLSDAPAAGTTIIIPTGPIR